MKEPVPSCLGSAIRSAGNIKAPSLAIATRVYWIYPERRVNSAEVVVPAASGEVNFSDDPGIRYYLMCRRIVCGAITPLPDSFRVKLV